MRTDPWSSGVTHWLTESHLGVRPLLPGFGAVLAAPHVSAANPHVGGTVDTPHGQLKLDAHWAASGNVRVTVDSPVDTLVALPRQRGDGSRCTLVGFRYTTSESIDVPRSAAQVSGDDALMLGSSVSLGRLHRDVATSLGYTMLLPSGRYSIEGVYDGCAPLPPVHATEHAPFPPFGPAAFPAHGSFDNATRGDWRGRYGKAGYVLFGFDNGTDAVRLPTWCVNVTANKRGHPRQSPLPRHYHGASKANGTYLQPPPGRPPTDSRALGSVGDECSDGCQGSIIDVNVSRAGKPYTVGLYMVGVAPQRDGPGHAPQLAIRPMDLTTFSPIAKLPLVSEFEGGVHWRLTYDRSVRLRVMPVFGGATVSAVFLDEE